MIAQKHEKTKKKQKKNIVGTEYRTRADGVIAR